jgi:hypothetical protein
MRLVAASMGGFASALVACSNVSVGIDDGKQEPFVVQINVTSDPGVPLAGALILSGTKSVGQTDDAGAARVKFGGKEGDQVELNVKCPTDYESPTSPLSIGLRRLGPGSPPPQFAARCAPALRTAVVGVRADKGPNLPITYLGRTVGRTDASGTALFVLRVKPADAIAITLNTTEKGGELLHPQNPTLTFVAQDRDDFVVLDQLFKVDRKPGGYHKVEPPRPVPLY